MLRRLLCVLALILAASMLWYGLGLAAPPQGFNAGTTPNAPYSINATAGSVLSDRCYDTMGVGALAVSGTTGTNLSVSQGTAVMSAGGLLGVTSTAGTYTFTPGTGTANIQDSQPVYNNSGPGLSIWSTTTGTTSSGIPAHAWVCAFTTDLGKPVASIACVVSGTNTIANGSLNNAAFSTKYNLATAGGTATTSGAYVSTAASQPCSNVTLSTTGTGCLVGTGTASGVFPLPANLPVTIPVSDVNKVWVSGGTATIGYLWVK